MISQLGETKLMISVHSCYVHLFNRGWLTDDGKKLVDHTSTQLTIQHEGKRLKLSGTFSCEDLIALGTAFGNEQ